MEWRFRRRQRGIIRHNSNENEFFDADEVGRSDALVREAIQNSLDARVDRSNGTAIVKFRFVPPGRLHFDSYVRALKPRLEACELWHAEAGLSGTGALIIEDFGTTGLTGSTADDAEGNFAYFWRCIGESGKSGPSGGRWGVGKRVFTDASHLCSVFGLTVRNSDMKQMLMGQAVLKGHQYDEVQYLPHAFYAKFEADEFQMPSEDHSEIERFKDIFGIERLDREPGLSLVIPCPDEEISERGLIEAAILNYFFPILTRRLVVEVNNQAIDSNTIEELIATVSPARVRQTFRTSEIKALFRFIRDAHSASENGDTELILARSLVGPLGKALFDDRTFGALAKSFHSQELVAVRVPLGVTKRGNPKQNTWFDLYLRLEAEGTGGTDVYVRGNLTLPEEHWLRSTDVFGMLIANEGPISEFLGDAERPSHKKWTASKEDWKRKYVGAVPLLGAVRKSLRDLVEALNINEDELDHDILGAFFSTPTLKDDESKQKKRKSRKPPKKLPKQQPQIVQTYRVDGGFRVSATSNADAGKFPKIVNVRVAYDTSRGNPFKRYRDFDFQLNTAPIEIDAVSARVLKRKSNSLQFEAQSIDFVVTVTGFDSNRDLRVQVH